MYRAKNSLLNRLLLIGFFVFISCTSISKRKIFLELEKIDKNKEIKTNGYYWRKNHYNFYDESCLNIDAFAFLEDFSVKKIMGTGKYCGKVSQLTVDSILSMEHKRIQSELTEGPDSDFYGEILYWGKYRTKQKKLIIAYVSGLGYGIGRVSLHTSKIEGEVISESMINLFNNVYKFKEFNFDVYYDMIPLKKYD